MTEIQHTFSMIKPDGTKRNVIGLVIAYLEEAGLEIVALKMTQLTQEQAKEFYAEHKDRPFFNSLIENITAGLVVMQVLKGVDAIAKNRAIMGSTNPEDAKKETIRGDLGEDINFNTVHGSDSLESAKREINFFFKPEEILVKESSEK